METTHGSPGGEIKKIRKTEDFTGSNLGEAYNYFSDFIKKFQDINLEHLTAVGTNYGVFHIIITYLE